MKKIILLLLAVTVALAMHVSCCFAASSVFTINYSEPNQSIFGNGTSIHAIISQNNSKEITLVLPNNSGLATTNYIVGSNLTIPKNAKLEIQKGARLFVKPGAAVTISGQLHADCGQIFVCEGLGKIVLAPGSVKEAYPEWWGAKGNNVTDDTVAVQAALNSYKQVNLRGLTYKVIYPLTTQPRSVLSGPGTLRMAVPGPLLYPGNYTTIKDLTLQGTYEMHPGAWAINALYKDGDPGADHYRDMGEENWQGAKLIIDNVTAMHFGWGGFQPGPQSKIVNSTVWRCYMEGILLLGNGCKIVNNTVAGMAAWGIDICSRYNIVSGNQIRDCGNYELMSAYNPANKEDGGGIVVNSGHYAPGVDQIVVSGNEITGSDLHGILVIAANGYPLRNCVVQGNVIKDVSRKINLKAGAISCLDFNSGNDNYLNNQLENVLIESNTIFNPGTPNIYQNIRQPGVVIKNNPGYNPTGSLAYTGGIPVVPTSGSLFQNIYSFDCLVTISGGKASNIILGKNKDTLWSTGLQSGTFVVPAGGYIRIDYTTAPKWHWFGL